MFTWTKNKPIMPGWYWKRNAGKKLAFGKEEHIVYVRDYVGKLCIQNWEIPDKDVEWAGPIPTPR